MDIPCTLGMRRGGVALIVAVLVLARLAGPASASGDAPGASAHAECFPATGFCVRGAFLAYWVASGGLAINGYPLTDQRLETLEDGRAYTVQYFERVRLEYHPENAVPDDVLLGQFGRHIHPADPPVGTSGNGTYYPETGHNIGGAFLAYWRGHGGLTQFGYPLSEQFREQLEDGREYTVQYFERARFELHPEYQPPYNVLLGQFGRHILAGATLLALIPCAVGALAARTTADAGAGQRYATVTLTNSGATACALAGLPQVQLLDAVGRPLAVAARADGDAPVDLVALPPGRTATFGLRWGNWCGPDPGRVDIRVALPGNGGQLTTSGIGTPPCLGAGQVSTLGVTPFRSEGVAAPTSVVR